MLKKNKQYDNNTQKVIEQIGEEMRIHEWSLTTAESCTGGGVAYAITAIPGVSEWFNSSYVTYSNTSKEHDLLVSKTLLREYGSVSQPVAIAMAEGALEKSQSDVTLAITGIAGPEGGTSDKPVGLVWFAWAKNNGQTSSDKQIFKGDRRKVRKKAIHYALEGLLMYLN